MAYEDEKTLMETRRLPDPPPSGADLDFDITGEQPSFGIQNNEATRTVPLQQTPPATENTANHVALPVGYQLFEYTIESLLGDGGFGQTYLARDNHLGYQVAIKEYLPHDLAIRVEGQTVCPRSAEWSPDYEAGIKRFLNEARTLASFRHPNIVRITRFFEANRTAYMVMDYERGLPLRDWKRNRPDVSEEELLAMFLPLLDGLEVVHQGQVTHRDIKPANIYVRENDGSLVLLDFGSARPTQGLGSQGLTTIVTPGYAPFEQYHSHGVQGPWSDIYALGGVLYWMISGERPTEAPARLKEDTMIPAREKGRGRYSQTFLAAIDWALVPDEEKRPRNVADFRAALTGQQQTAPATDTVTPPEENSPAKKGSSKGLVIGAIVLALAAAGLAGKHFLTQPEAEPEPLQIAHDVPAPAPAEPAPQPATPEAPAAAEAVATPAPEEHKPAAAVAEKRRDTPNRPKSGNGTADKTAKSEKAARQEEPSPPQASAADNAAQSSQMAKVALKIVPQGTVYLDGKKIGKSPPMMEIPVSAGAHKLEIHGDAMPYVAYHSLTLKPGQTTQVWQKFGND